MCDYISYAFPEEWFVVRVRYSGDIAIGYCRTEEGKEPRKIDNSKEFTEIFHAPRGFDNTEIYEKAKKYAQSVSRELQIPFPGGYSNQ